MSDLYALAIIGYLIMGWRQHGVLSKQMDEMHDDERPSRSMYFCAILTVFIAWPYFWGYHSER